MLRQRHLTTLLTTVTVTALFVGVAQGGARHGMGTHYPAEGALPDAPPYTTPGKADLPVGGFGRLFALHSPLDPDDLNVGTLRPHPSPRHDLVRLGRAMFGVKGDPADGELPVGYVFLGQFIDHDLTLDVVSGFDRLVRGDDVANMRTVDLDLDCVYGDGPEATPFLYNLPYLRVGAPLVERVGVPMRFDVLRVSGPLDADTSPHAGGPTALIGDPRNDENFAVAQMQAAFVAFHNRIVDRLIAHTHGDASAADLTPAERMEIFEGARDHVIHFYHRVVIEDFLPRIIGVERLRQMVVTGRDFYFPDGFDGVHGKMQEPFIPIEFSVAGYRFGHSQVRNTYTLRAEDETPVRANLFIDRDSDPDTINPRGFTPIRGGKTNLVFEWHRFVDIGAPWDQVQRAQRIDPKLANVLSLLDRAGVVPPGGEGNLASRNLNRGRTFQLPSGQDLAVKILTRLADKGVLEKVYVPGDDTIPTCPDAPERVRAYCLAADPTTVATLGIEATPLWYYVLQEASVFGCPITGCDPTGRDVSATETRGITFRVGMQAQNGFVLGPVGSAIVGETLYGFIDHYRAATGKGLDYTPALRPDDSEGDLIPFDTSLDKVSAIAASSSGTTETVVEINGEQLGRRYMLRNLIVDAGLHESFVTAGMRVCDGTFATSPDADCTTD